MTLSALLKVLWEKGKYFKKEKRAGL